MLHFANLVHVPAAQTTSLGVAFFFTAETYTVFDALLTVMPWYQRYYAGGYKKAYVMAKQKIREEEKKTYQEVISIIRKSKE